MNVEGERVCGTHLDGGRDIHIAQDMLQDIDGNFDILARWDLDLLHFTFAGTYISQTRFSGKLRCKSRGRNKWRSLFFLQYLVLFILVLVFKKFLAPLLKLICLLVRGAAFPFGLLWLLRRRDEALRRRLDDELFACEPVFNWLPTGPFSPAASTSGSGSLARARSFVSFERSPV